LLSLPPGHTFVQKRSELAKLTDLGDETQRAKRQALSEIIDTTLLKCYLEVVVHLMIIFSDM
jgi:hypothetical protein